MVKLWQNAVIWGVLFIAGGACIFFSINIQLRYSVIYDVNTTGVVIFVHPNAMSFDYAFDKIYTNTWILPLPLGVNNQSNILVSYSSKNPQCSEVYNYSGYPKYYCDTIFERPWTWQILFLIGILAMVGSSYFIFKFMIQLSGPV